MSILTDSRRNFIKIFGGLGAGILAGFNLRGSNVPPVPVGENSTVGFRSAGANYMGDFAAPKIEMVRCAFIGVGSRGYGHAEQIAEIEGTEVVAISDLYQDLANKAADICKEKGKGKRHQNIALYHGTDDGWKKMLTDHRPDAVFVVTPWELHAPMAVEAMKQGAHAFVEVPLALTLEEMWEIVDASESTGKHCMMMENVNYGREELVFLNMCRQGVIGELLHGEAAYIHELRGQMEEVERGTGSWRTYHYAKRNGNLYPTHGPIDFLKNFKGALHTDGYAAYEKFDDKPGVTLLACMAHARRYFDKALDNDKTRASYALAKIQALYAIERQAKEEGFSFEQRQQLRQQEAVPVLEEFEQWLKANLPQVLPKSAIAQAIAYALKLWPRLIRYTQNGAWQIDNNLVENSIRPVALGRKNYLFAGSHQAAGHAAMMYSFLGTCKLNGHQSL